MKVRRKMRKERFLGDFEEMGVRKCEGRVEMKKGERERERKVDFGERDREEKGEWGFNGYKGEKGLRKEGKRL